MQPDQGRLDRRQVAHDERDRLVARLVLHAIADDPAAGRNGGQVRLGDALDELLAEAAVLDQGLDRDDRQAVLAGDLVQLLASGHLDPIGDLAEDAGGRQAGKPGQVHGRLGMPRAAEHAPLLGHQRKEMAGSDQVVGPGGRVDDRPDRPRPLLGADPRAARPVIHRHRERRLVRRRVAVDHRAELEPAAISGMIGMHKSPRPCVIMNSTVSGVTFSAAAMKSPSFSRSSSSTTMMIRPSLRAWSASSILEIAHPSALPASTIPSEGESPGQQPDLATSHDPLAAIATEPASPSAIHGGPGRPDWLEYESRSH